MGDAAGQDAQTLEFLGMLHLRFEGAPFLFRAHPLLSGECLGRLIGQFGGELNLIAVPPACSSQLFMGKHAYQFAAHPDRRIQKRTHALRLQVMVA